MRTDDDAFRARGPQYYDGQSHRPVEPRPLPHLAQREAGHALGLLPEVAASRLSRMLRAQAQHHQGRR